MPHKCSPNPHTLFLLRFISIIPSHRRLCRANGHFPLGFPAIALWASVTSATRATCLSVREADGTQTASHLVIRSWTPLISMKHNETLRSIKLCWIHISTKYLVGSRELSHYNDYATDWQVRFRFPAGIRYVSLLQNVQRVSLPSYSMGKRGKATHHVTFLCVWAQLSYPQYHITITFIYAESSTSNPRKDNINLSYFFDSWSFLSHGM